MRRITIELPDGVAKRALVAAIDSGRKPGKDVYLEIFIHGLAHVETELKEKRTAPATQTNNRTRTK